MATATRALAVVCVIASAASANGCTGATQLPVDRLGSSAEPAAPASTTLTPTQHGYVRVESSSGSVGCSVITDVVACQRLLGEWPVGHGAGLTASVSAGGDFRWVKADLGELQGRVRLRSGTFTAPGWTIIAGATETRFVNSRNSHGMTCTDQGVSPF